MPGKNEDNKTVDNRNFAIGILSTTATILFVGLLMVSMRSEPAHAGSMTVTSGKFVLTVATRTVGDEEILMVLNAPEQRMIAYRYDTAQRELQVVSGIDMKLDLQAAVQPPQGQRRRGSNRRP